MGMVVELGLDTFGDIPIHPGGKRQPSAQVIRDVIAQGALADEVGVDFFGIGEHHRDDFAVSAPEIVLAAIASRTRRIRLGASVIVLGSDDPVRIYERYATLDAASDGRAEILVGRGSFMESFSLFGFDLARYDELFEEKLELLARVAKEHAVTWEGTVRSPLKSQHVYPKTAGGMPIWVAASSTPASAARAATHGFQLVLAVVNGPPAGYLPLVAAYREARREPAERSIAVHCPGFVAATDAEAREIFWPCYDRFINGIAKERGWPPRTRADFEQAIATGAIHVGSAETVARKIAETLTSLGAHRFQMKYSTGGIHHDQLMTAIELYGTQVIPRVRELLS